ncbi:MAG: hypothetical protein U0930_17330 [Pirellulales bacterium]
MATDSNASSKSTVANQLNSADNPDKIDPKLLYVDLDSANSADCLPISDAGIAVEHVQNLVAALGRLGRKQYSGVLLDGQSSESTDKIVRLLQSERILDGMPEGVALVNADMQVSWANSCLREWSVVDNPLGNNFYSLLGDAHILGPDFCPFHTAGYRKC